MFNRKANFTTRQKVGDDDGTPVYSDVPVYSGVPIRSEQVNSSTEETGDASQKRRITRRLMVKPRLNGQPVHITEDMTVFVDGVAHDIKGVKPVEGASPKPIYFEVMAVERIA